MKSKYFALLALITLIGFTGCCSGGRCCLPFGGGLFGGGCCEETCCDEGCCDETCCGETCGETPCEPARCGLLDRCCLPCRQPAPAMGPTTGAVAYPYYTNRGPRDFLAENPPSIGP